MKTILEIANSFPTDGTHPYFWPRAADIAANPSLKSYAGVTEDLLWQGTLIAKAEAQKRTYCCGFVFEVWFKAALASELEPIKNLGPLDMKRIRQGFFVASNDRSGAQAALVSRRLGTRVELKDALPGDIVQLWRASGSGHTTIFLASDETKLTYKSTQVATNGIGVRSELHGGKNPLTEIYIVRPIL